MAPIFYNNTMAASTTSHGGPKMDSIFLVSLVVVAFSLGAWSAGIYRQEPALVSGGIGILGMLVSLLA